MSSCRLSSFGFSGTIAHGAFGVEGLAPGERNGYTSLYRSLRNLGGFGHTRLHLNYSIVPQDDNLVLRESTSILAPFAGALFSHHVVGGSILLPGVGYVEMALAFQALGASSVLSFVAFVRPCVMSPPE